MMDIEIGRIKVWSTQIFTVLLLISCCGSPHSYEEKARMKKEQFHVDLRMKHQGAVASAKAVGMPIVIYRSECGYPNIVGGIDVSIYFINISEKTIKYVTFEVIPYNAVGDVVASEIGGEITAYLKETGPIESGKANITPSTSWSGWKAVWYNPTVKCIEIVGIEVIFMDGATISVDRSMITKCLAYSVLNDCRTKF
jgi:hypothetical protein